MSDLPPESEWSRAPRVTEPVARSASRRTHPAAARSRANADGRRGRGRRVLCRIFALLPFLGWGGVALTFTWYEMVFGYIHNDPHLLLLSITLMLVVPFYLYSLFSRFHTVRLLGVAGSFVTSALIALPLIMGVFEILRYSGRVGEELLLVGGLLAITLTCGFFALWLMRLELERLRPIRAEVAVTGWEAGAPGAAASNEPPAADPEAPKLPPPLSNRRKHLYRVLALLPLGGYGLWLSLMLLSQFGLRSFYESPLLLLPGVIGLMLLFGYGAWARSAWLRCLSAGACALIGVTAACGQSMALIETVRSARWRYDWVLPTTFGISDPNLLIHISAVLLVVLGCLISTRFAVVLLYYTIVDFRRTATASKPRTLREDDDLTAPGNWDQGGGSHATSHHPQ